MHCAYAVSDTALLLPQCLLQCLLQALLRAIDMLEWHVFALAIVVIVAARATFSFAPRASW